MSSGSNNNSGNYHSQQHHHRHFLAPANSNLAGRQQQHLQQQQQQSKANPPLTTMTDANGLPAPPPGQSAKAPLEPSQQHPLARQHQHNINGGSSNNNNNHHHNIMHHHHQTKGCPQSSQAGQQQQQQQLARHFYGPIESMTMHRANVNGSHHHRQQEQAIVFAADQSVAAARQQQQQQHSPMANTAMGRGRGETQHASQPTGGEHNFNTSTVRSRAEQHQLYQDSGLYQQQQHLLHHRQSGSHLNNNNNNRHNHHNHHHQQHHQHNQHQPNHHAKQMPPANQECGFAAMSGECPCDRSGLEDYHQDQDYGPAMSRLEHEQQQQDASYANQLRRSQLQQQHQQQHNPKAPPSASSSSATSASTSSRHLQVDQHQQQQHHHNHNHHHHRQPAATAATGSPSDSKTHSQAGRESLHVNFNRSSQRGANEPDDDEPGETTRKKKYLTAKYGQQQMNLIKKRLKIEMWLHDQLQELAKLSESIEQDELDEIDIDLDQLLDMDDEPTRRHWLRKTLEPLSDLPKESIDKFISDVLEQSKLL